jgi:hypothetical protein
VKKILTTLVVFTLVIFVSGITFGAEIMLDGFILLFAFILAAGFAVGFFIIGMTALINRGVEKETMR